VDCGRSAVCRRPVSAPLFSPQVTLAATTGEFLGPSTTRRISRSLGGVGEAVVTAARGELPCHEIHPTSANTGAIPDLRGATGIEAFMDSRSCPTVRSELSGAGLEYGVPGTQLTVAKDTA
jgi:hypothetical protein